jgi:hypothetical protein
MNLFPYINEFGGDNFFFFLYKHLLSGAVLRRHACLVRENQDAFSRKILTKETSNRVSLPSQCDPVIPEAMGEK